jgi:hypothetical protein
MTRVQSPVAILRAAGEALYGSDWQSPLARDLNVDGRTVRFWISGRRPVPDTIVERLPRIMRDAAAARRASAASIEALAATLA